MRRYLIISLVILPAVMLIAIVALTTSPSGTRHRITAALEGYLQYRAPFSASIDMIEQIVPATSPRSFTRQMSRGTLDYLKIYRSITNTILLPSWLNQTSPVTNWVSFASPYDRWPLAYPPTDVWCVRLKPNGNRYPEVVFVALHEDDYHSEWIVHDPAAITAQQLSVDLAALGCSEVEQP